MNIITVDFETYYDKDYSLSKITTEEYLRDPRYQTIGVGVKVNDGPTEWASGKHEAMRDYLQSFDWANSFCLAHNTMFDGAILAWHYQIYPKVLLDTLSMARAFHGVNAGGSLAKLVARYNLGEKGTEVINALGKRREDFTPDELSRYGDYCINDVELTYKLFKVFMEKGFPQQELKLIDTTLRMFTEPALELDYKLLRKHLRATRTAKEDLLTAAGITDKKDLMSNQKFAALLEEQGVVVPLKTSPATGKQTYAFAKTDQEFLELQEHENPCVQTLVAARLGNKSTLEETRTQRFIDIAERGLMPVPIRYYAAHTGRWGGSDKINLQNLPSRGPNGKVLKRAIMAPDGHFLYDCDSSQIEARVLAWLSGQDDLVKAFANKEDVYVKMASAIYSIPEEQVTPQQRFVGKTTILGCGYGMGAARFQDQLATFGVELDIEECRRIVTIYRNTNDRIKDLWGQANTVLAAMLSGSKVSVGRPGVLEVLPDEYAVRMPSGLLIRYDELEVEDGEKGPQYSYATRQGRTKIYGGKCVENWTQGIARCIIGEQMLRISKRYKPALTVHDSVASIVPLSEAAEGKAYIDECMRWVPEWAEGLPIDCEGFGAIRYGDCDEKSKELVV